MPVFGQSYRHSHSESATSNLYSVDARHVMFVELVLGWVSQRLLSDVYALLSQSPTFKLRSPEACKAKGVSTADSVRQLQ